MKKNHIVAIFFLFISLVISFISGKYFLKMRQPDKIIPNKSNNLTIKSLSEYFKGIDGTNGDTPVYIFAGDEPGASFFILGGTHPDEPAGYLTAICLIENIHIKQGRIIIVPRANNSGFTHSDPQEGNPQRFSLETRSGKRWFRYGSRSTNPVDQWPDPEVYLHFPSGQKLSGSETRNLNRAYPGKPNGNLTEKVAYAIMQILEKEKIDLAIDLHEASLEYPVVNAIVAHPLGFEIAAEMTMNLQMEGLPFNLEQSPENFRGLSHREWGDYAKIPALLLESASTVHGRYQGKKTADAIISGKDRFYNEAAQHGLLSVEYPEAGIPLKERVGRHIIAIKTIINIWNDHNPAKEIVVDHLPEYTDLLEKGVGAFLN